MDSGDNNKTTLLTCARKAAKVLAEQTTTPSARADACLGLIKKKKADERLASFQERLRALPIDERHYWVGTLYTLMLPAKVRRSQAAYFTPPIVANAVVDLAIEAGFNMERDTVLDPAAGGAAFLSTLARRMKDTGLDSTDVARRLNGIEIDEGLSRLSRRLVEEQLGAKLPKKNIVTADALKTSTATSFDLVIANPPYGRLSLDEVHGDEWKRIAHSGHINKYALFAELSFRIAKTGGLVVLVIPSSFRAGPLYDRMREFVRAEAQVLAIASIQGRDGVFVDVAQDVSVLVARKGKPHDIASPVRFPIIGTDLPKGPVVEEKLPEETGAGWPLPATDPKTVGGATLADYGVQAKAGYFVWNREGDRMRTSPGDDTVYPLIWAKNIRPGEFCRPAGRNGSPIDLVQFDGPSTSIVRKSAAVLQRTTNDKQPRRLIAAMVDPQVVKKWGGFVTENHTIVLTSDDAEQLVLLVTLLNTGPVDQRYRRVSGTAAVSVSLLRELDLPSPQAFAKSLKAARGDAEAAAAQAYLSQPALVRPR
tara:strand:+ start:370 stop:1980 length:1611 start_codon:yes stop_codon:yes gene_type:complete